MLGKRAQDKITGFTGVIVGHIEYLTGCNQYGIAPPVDKDGKVQQTEWFDESRITVLGEGPTLGIPETTPAVHGGPNRDAPR